MALSSGGFTLARYVLKPIRTLSRKMRAAYNRAMHPMRRRRALRAIRSAGSPSRILFVCHGNICRSPYAEGALRRDLPESLESWIQCRSAGFIGPNRSSPPEALEVAAERSVDLSEHRSRLLESALVRSADLVFVMDRGQRSAIRGRFRSTEVLLLGDLDPRRPDRRRIRDPIAQPVEVFRSVYERIDRCVGELVRHLQEHCGPVPGSDVDRPIDG